MIIDNGSCANVVSKYVVDKLDLPMINHPNPYLLQWMSDCGEMKVAKQAKIPVEIGDYKGKILCDVTPMTACHILLGRPWMSDNGVKYDGRYNKIRFTFQGQRIVIATMSPQKVRADYEELKKRFAEAERKQKGPSLDTEKKPKSSSTRKLKDKAESSKQGSPVLLSFKSFKSELKSDTIGDHMFMLVCKEEVKSETPDPLFKLPDAFRRMLDTFSDVYPEELSKVLLPTRGIEHRIDFVPGAIIPNRAAYRCNP